MMELLQLFSVDAIWFSIFDYPMSYIEFIGTILYLASVILIAQKNMLTWPVGILSVILYALLFYQIQLYSDAIEQLYYLGASIYGWIYWNRSRSPGGARGGSTAFRFSGIRTLVVWVIFTLLFTAGITLFMARIHILLPELFPLPASFPFLDALTTVMSFVAMFLMAQKRIESWVYWIIVDLIGIVLYFVKDVRFIALLYLFLLVIAVRGLLKWVSDYRMSGETPEKVKV
jgi:nicotinamide mononucleotide transporter